MKIPPKIFLIFAALLGVFLMPGSSLADDVIINAPRIIEQSPDVRPRSLPIVIKDHRFNPDKITLLAQERVILHIVNNDDSAEEFYSRYLKRQKIVPGNSFIDVGIGPLKPGVYDFIGSYHSDTAQGRITVPQLGWNYNNQQ